jgi:hypothetical protein
MFTTPSCFINYTVYETFHLSLHSIFHCDTFRPPYVSFITHFALKSINRIPKQTNPFRKLAVYF